MNYPTRESPPRDAASPIKYNGLCVRPAAVCAQPAVPYRDIIDWPAVLCCQRLQEASRVNLNSKKKKTRRNLTNINPKNTKKSPIHENMNAKITCDFGDERFRIAAAGLEKDKFVRTHLHTARLVVRMCMAILHALPFREVLFGNVVYQ